MNTCSPTLGKPSTTGTITTTRPGESYSAQPVRQSQTEADRVFEARLRWFLAMSAAA